MVGAIGDETGEPVIVSARWADDQQVLSGSLFVTSRGKKTQARRESDRSLVFVLDKRLDPIGMQILLIHSMAAMVASSMKPLPQHSSSVPDSRDRSRGRRLSGLTNLSLSEAAGVAAERQ